MKSRQSVLQRISPMRLILWGYCLIILIGTILLALPAATRGPGSTPVTDCFFTATSATCITGLVRFDTFTHWTLFGQLVILFMIQTGGIGFMTVAILVLVLAGRKISLNQRMLMQNSISAPQLGGIVKMTRFIVLGTGLVEAVGAGLLAVDFVPRFGWKRGLYFSVFHAVSAFCNAGFDLMGGQTGAYSSLTGMQGNWYVCIVMMLLFFIGGLGFFVWQDVREQKWCFRKLSLQSKLVLSTSTGLVILGMVVFYFLERNGVLLQGMSETDKLLTCLFHSVSARTAGFATIDLAALTEPAQLVLVSLMMIGGSTGSTAGGMKTTTFWVLCASIAATFRRKKNIEAFGRRMEEGITRTAACIFMTYLLLSISSAIVIAALEEVPIMTALVEAVSALTTGGISFGLTPRLGLISEGLLTFLMLCGRVGSVTMLLAFSSEKKGISSKLPLEKLQIG